MGHECATGEGPFSLPEGGEARIEHFQYTPDGSGDETAFQVFHFTDQDPPSRLPGGDEIPHDVPGVVCNDFSAGIYFDNGRSEAAQQIVNTRDYIDLGDTATLTSENGTAITLMKQQAGTPDLSSSLEHPILYLGDKTLIPEFNTSYTISIAGTPTVPGLDLAYGTTPFAEEIDGSSIVYFPREFTLTEPTEEEFYAENGFTITRGEDLNLSWSYEGELRDEFPGAASFVAFVDANGQAQAGCTILPEAPDTFTVPAEIFDFEAVPDQGFMLVGFFHHVAYEERQTTTRFDTLGINCKLAQYTIVDPGTAATK